MKEHTIKISVFGNKQSTQESWRPLGTWPEAEVDRGMSPNEGDLYKAQLRLQTEGPV